MDIIYPNEGLLNDVYALVAGASPLGGTAGTVYLDVVQNLPSPSDIGVTYSSLSLGVGTASFSAVSLNVSGTNLVAASDFTILVNLGNTGVISASTITFTNISGADVNLYGWCMYDPYPAALPSPSGNPLLINFALFDGGPITVPNGGTIAITPVLGDQSLLSS